MYVTAKLCAISLVSRSCKYAVIATSGRWCRVSIFAFPMASVWWLGLPYASSTCILFVVTYVFSLAPLELRGKGAKAKGSDSRFPFKVVWSTTPLLFGLFTYGAFFHMLSWTPSWCLYFASLQSNCPHPHLIAFFEGVNRDIGNGTCKLLCKHLVR